MKIGQSALLFLIINLSILGGVLGATLYVDGNGVCGENSPCYTSIQYGIGNASEGDIIIIFPDIYWENVIVSKSINLIGSGPDVIVTNVESEPNTDVIYVNASNVNISGLTIWGATDPFYSGIFLDSATNCNIFNNSVYDNYYNILLSSSSMNTIENNNLLESIFTWYHIQLDTSSNNNLILGNNITASPQCEQGVCNGIRATEASNVTIENNHINVYGSVGLSLDTGLKISSISGNTIKSENIGIFLYDNLASQSLISDNDIGGNNIGISGTNVSGFSIWQNNLSDCMTGVFLDISGDNAIVGNYFLGNDYAGMLSNSYDNSFNGNSIINTSVYGFYLVSSDLNTISSNHMNSGGTGIVLDQNSGLSNIENNTIFNYGTGISVQSNDNEFVGNQITDNSVSGIILSGSINIVRGNNLSRNTQYGILTTSATERNLIYNNYFSRNGMGNGKDFSRVNIWNSTYQEGTNIISGSVIGGNYWDDYSGIDDGSGSYPHDIIGDGIGDTFIPYISGENIPGDYLPLRNDITPPITSCDAPEGWQNSDFTVNLTAIDLDSGVSGTYYFIDDSDRYTGISIPIITEANHSILFYSVDTKGNEEQPKTCTAALDKTPPSIDNLFISGQVIPVGGFVYIDLVAYDYTSGIAQVNLNLTYPNGTSTLFSPWSGDGMYGWDVNASVFGQYTAQIIASDYAGNVNDSVKWVFYATRDDSTNVIIPANKSVEIINNGLLSVTVGGGNTATNITINTQVSPSSQAFGIMGANLTGNIIGTKYLNITNSTPMDGINNITIKIFYGDNESLDEDTLSLFFWNGNKWFRMKDYIGKRIDNNSAYPFVFAAGVDKTTKYVYATLDHFTVYGVGGNVKSTGTPSLIPTSGGGGGGGGGSSVNNIYIGKIDPGESKSADFPGKSSPAISKVQISVLKTVYSMSVSLTYPSSKPYGLEDIPGKVFKYIDINKPAIVSDIDIEEATISFKVEKKWIEENEVDRNSIALMRYVSNKWEALTTSISREDSDYVYFDSQSPGFSHFAIVGDIVNVLELPPECQTGETETQACDDGTTATLRECVDGKWTLTGDSCPVECQPGEIQKDDCPDGISIITSQCNNGKWEATGNLCQENECAQGETRTETCDDGSEIISQECSEGKWTDSDNQCPEKEEAAFPSWVVMLIIGSLVSISGLYYFKYYKAK